MYRDCDHVLVERQVYRFDQYFGAQVCEVGWGVWSLGGRAFNPPFRRVIDDDWSVEPVPDDEKWT